MPAPTAPAAPSARAALVVLRVLAAAALGVSALLHVVLAQGPLVSGGQVTLAGLFIAQAIVATLIALAVLLSGHRLAWIAAAVVGLGSLAALVLSVYVQIPAVGPFPTLYEPLWYGEKVLAAASAALAAVVAVVALRRRTGR